MWTIFFLAGCANPDGMGESDTAPPETELPEGVFLVDLDTTTGPVVLEIHEAWAPLGVARFRELVESGFYDGARYFRVVPGFVVQFGIAADPAVHAMWSDRPIADDPVVASNERRTVTFATAGPNTRTTQLFVNLGPNASLDAQGFAPIGQVREGMPNVRSINDEYGEAPNPFRIEDEGNAYLDAEFPRLDGIVTARVRE